MASYRPYSLICLLAALTGTPAAAQPAPSPTAHGKAAQQFKAELKSLEETAEPLIKKSQALRAQYSDPHDYSEILKKRRVLAAQLHAALRTYNELRGRSSEFEKVVQTQKMARGISILLSGKKPDTKRALGEFGTVFLFQNIRKEIAAARDKIKDEIQDEEKAFAAMRAEHAEKRRTLYLVGGVTGALVLSLTLSLWISRRKSAQPVPITAYPTAPVTTPGGAMLSGPASAPATTPGGDMLSGPAGAPGLPAPAGPVQAVVLGDNFRIEREIGRGGMGLVFEATDLTLQRKVAIKQLKAEVIENQKGLEMFLAEARLVASLKHPNLVEIFSIIRENARLYLVFEFVAGTPLHETLDEGEPIHFKKAADILRQAASGLDYAHSQKVIHRDLKPSNIMITEKGGVKLMDFGIAHQAKKTVARLTRADAWGTPPYMAPEQELGNVSRESDLYALAVCFYEMITARPPFEGPNFLAQKREMAFEPPSALAPGLPKGIDAVIAKALQAETKNRYHSGAELLAALDGASGSPAA